MVKLGSALAALALPLASTILLALPEAAGASAGTAGAAQRERVNFDFSWRHHLGNVSKEVAFASEVPVEASASFPDASVGRCCA